MQSLSMAPSLKSRHSTIPCCLLICPSTIHSSVLACKVVVSSSSLAYTCAQKHTLQHFLKSILNYVTISWGLMVVDITLSLWWVNPDCHKSHQGDNNQVWHTVLVVGFTCNTMSMLLEYLTHVISVTQGFLGFRCVKNNQVHEINQFFRLHIFQGSQNHNPLCNCKKMAHLEYSYFF